MKLNITAIAFASMIALSCADASKTPKTLEPGADAPKWENLVGTDDQKHSLKDLEDKDIVVVVFSSNTCPFAVAYEDRLNAVAKKYADKSVALVAINVEPDEKNDLDAMKERAESKEFAFPYLRDESQGIAKKFGAIVTPHCFVLNKERKISYVGAFDSSMKEEKADEKYVIDAIEALLNGSEPDKKTTRPAGCRIRYND